MNILVITLALLGAGFMLVAGIGVLRLNDLYMRLHASTKAATLGVALLLSAAALHVDEPGVAMRCFMAVLFFLLTAPVAGHLIARAAYHRGEPLAQGTLDDELARDQARARHRDSG